MMMRIEFQLAIAAIASVWAVQWIFLKILRIAQIKGLVDNPNARKLQKNPVPVLGGIAVFFGFMVGLLVYTLLTQLFPWPVSDGFAITPALPVVLCCCLMLYVGSMDDVLGLTPVSRLVIEVLTMLALIFGTGMCVDSFHGLWGVEEFSWWIAVPLTVFAGVGLINAYNMVDGVNGLSSGLCILSASLISVICYKRSDFANSALALCYVGSLLPFLMHNVFGKRSRMFIGDGGTMVMGMLASWFMIRILSSDNAESLTLLATPGRDMGLVAMMLAVVCVPVFDTIRVMTSRMKRGVSPFKADMTHLHHVFVASGFGHLVTSLCEIAINIILVAIWLVVYRLGASVEVQLYVVMLFSVVLVWGPYFYLSRVVRKHPESRVLQWTKKTNLESLSWWKTLQNWLDKGSYNED